MFNRYGLRWNHVNGTAFIIPITLGCLLWKYAPSKVLKSELRISVIYAIIIVPSCTIIDACNIFIILDDIQQDEICQLTNLHSDAYKYNHRAHRCQSNLKRCVIGDCMLSLGILGYMLLTTCYFPRNFRILTSVNTDDKYDKDLEVQSFAILRTITLSEILLSETYFLSFMHHLEEHESNSLGVVLCYIEMVQFKAMVDSTFNLSTNAQTSRLPANDHDGFERISSHEIQGHDCEYYQFGIINNSEIPESDIVYHSNEHQITQDCTTNTYIWMIEN